MSFAIPKGLPGNPNSRSIGRMAIETRVHNYWNHLIESASGKTGSLLIWDTGTYNVLPRITKKCRIPSPQTTDDENTESDTDDEKAAMLSNTSNEAKHDNEKLILAFQTRYIRLRLQGTKLPKRYTIILRLPSNEITKRPAARRKTSQNSGVSKSMRRASRSSDSGDQLPRVQEHHDENLDTESEEDAQTHATNAYPGSMNNIGSIHQRHWFLQLDRQNSGFVLDKIGSSKGQ